MDTEKIKKMIISAGWQNSDSNISDFLRSGDCFNSPSCQSKCSTGCSGSCSGGCTNRCASPGNNIMEGGRKNEFRTS